LTHFHPDHVAGANAFPEVAHVVAHVNHAQAMTQRAQFYLQRFKGILNASAQSVFRVPTLTVTTGQTIDIDLGERRLSIEAFALAHTDNDITVYDHQTNTLWASDLLFSERTPSLDGSLNGWLDVLSSLDKRGYGLTIPGHGAPAPWASLLAPQQGYLLELRDTVRQLLDKGISLSTVLALHDANDTSRTSWVLYAPQHGSNLAKAYSELEWE
jgi:glyoxylase-like metal-dependent hydrolase (beta-lactamase superfamily II)